MLSERPRSAACSVSCASLQHAYRSSPVLQHAALLQYKWRLCGMKLWLTFEDCVWVPDGGKLLAYVSVINRLFDKCLL